LIYPSDSVIRPDKEPSLAGSKLFYRDPIDASFGIVILSQGLFFRHNASAIEYESKHGYKRNSDSKTGCDRSYITHILWNGRAPGYHLSFFVQTYKIKIILLKGTLMDAKTHN
jgi:hypothetical protein